MAVLGIFRIFSAQWTIVAAQKRAPSVLHSPRRHANAWKSHANRERSHRASLLSNWLFHFRDLAFSEVKACLTVRIQFLWVLISFRNHPFDWVKMNTIKKIAWHSHFCKPNTFCSHDFRPWRASEASITTSYYSQDIWRSDTQNWFFPDILFGHPIPSGIIVGDQLLAPFAQPTKTFRKHIPFFRGIQ